MFKRDYTREIGMASPTLTISWPYAVVILALVLAGLAWFASTELKAYHRMPHATPELSLAATRSAHAPDAGKASTQTVAKPARHRVS